MRDDERGAARASVVLERHLHVVRRFRVEGAAFAESSDSTARSGQGRAIDSDGAGRGESSTRARREKEFMTSGRRQ